MFTYLQASAMRMIQRNDWMDNTTSAAAAFKLDRMALKVPEMRPMANETAAIVTEYEQVNKFLK